LPPDGLSALGKSSQDVHKQRLLGDQSPLASKRQPAWPIEI
jgi:hypothetical protein